MELIFVISAGFFMFFMLLAMGFVLFALLEIKETLWEIQKNTLKEQQPATGKNALNEKRIHKNLYDGQ